MIDSPFALLQKPQARSTAPRVARNRGRASAGMRNLAFAFGLTLSLTGAAWSTDRTSVEARWQAAEDAYATQHFALALHEFEQLAKEGDLHAAERAGQMLFFGEALYGKEVPRDAKRAGRWLAQAAQDGSEVAAFLLQRSALPVRNVASNATAVPADKP